jgi:hypothetical protein
VPASSPQVSTTPARPAPPCERQNLNVRYLGGGDGGQTFMGDIVVWNVGAHPCLVGGAVTFAAYSATGVPDVQAVANGRQPPVSATLPAAMPSFRDNVSNPNNYLYAQLAAPQFNADPSCTAHSAPATFTLTIGRLTFQVANRDPGATQNKILIGCDGRILLEQIYPPTGD